MLKEMRKGSASRGLHSLGEAIKTSSPEWSGVNDKDKNQATTQLFPRGTNNMPRHGSVPQGERGNMSGLGGQNKILGKKRAITKCSFEG